ncbi:MAG: hypothetical protein LBF25_00755, partial [Puniceicoccales bacterium]|nr:hypothetical protein [Puniceicoccales bacterium]
LIEAGKIPLNNLFDWEIKSIVDKLTSADLVKLIGEGKIDQIKLPQGRWEAVLRRLSTKTPATPASTTTQPAKNPAASASKPELKDLKLEAGKPVVPVDDIIESLRAGTVRLWDLSADKRKKVLAALSDEKIISLKNQGKMRLKELSPLPSQRKKNIVDKLTGIKSPSVDQLADFVRKGDLRLSLLPSPMRKKVLAALSDEEIVDLMNKKEMSQKRLDLLFANRKEVILKRLKNVAPNPSRSLSIEPTEGGGTFSGITTPTSDFKQSLSIDVPPTKE